MVRTNFNKNFTRRSGGAKRAWPPPSAGVVSSRPVSRPVRTPQATWQAPAAPAFQGCGRRVDTTPQEVARMALGAVSLGSVWWVLILLAHVAA